MNIQSLLAALPQIGVIAASFVASYFFYGWIADAKSEDIENLQNARTLRRQVYQRALDELNAADVEAFPILADSDTIISYWSQEPAVAIEEWSFDNTLVQS